MKYDRLMISGPDFAIIVKTILEKGKTAKFKATGNSMLPNIINNDVVSLCPYRKKEPEIGDIVALKDKATGRIIIHRLIKKSNLFFIKGDSAIRGDGLFSREDIIGFVSEIERNRRTIPINMVVSDKIILMSRLRLFFGVKIFRGLQKKIRKLVLKLR